GVTLLPPPDNIQPTEHGQVLGTAWVPLVPVVHSRRALTWSESAGSDVHAPARRCWTQPPRCLPTVVTRVRRYRRSPVRRVCPPARSMRTFPANRNCSWP